MDGEEETVTVNIDDAFILKSDIDELCRLCANTDNQLIPIFKGEGLEHSIPSKIGKHLPIIKVTELDKLPLQICYQCASTLIAWHNLYEGCQVADKKLREIFSISSKLYQDDEGLTEYVEDYVNDFNDQSQDNYQKFPFSDSVNPSDIPTEEILISSPLENTTLDITPAFEETVEDTPNERCDSDISKLKKDAAKTNDTVVRSIIEANLADQKCDKDSSSQCHDDTSAEITQKSSSGNLTDPRIPAEYQQYLRMHTNGIKYLQCDKCEFICRPLTCLFTKHYKKHELPHMNDSPASPSYVDEVVETTATKSKAIERIKSSGKKYPCHKCTKLFDKRKSLCRHLKIHQARVFTCKQCECKFKTRMAFRAHKERHKRQKEVLFCDQCGKHFRSRNGYKYHRENKCSRLPSTAKDERELSDERRLETNNSMCFVCGKIVRDVNLERHMMIHTEEKPFVCDLCGKRFKLKSGIRDHMMIKLGMKDYVCEICGRKFVKKCYLTKHLRFHFIDKEDLKPYRCDICSKKFADKRQLVAHKRSAHDTEKPYCCDLCGKSYNSKVLLRQHLVREVICVICDEIFSSNDLLKQHVVLVHTVNQFREAAKEGIKTQASFVFPCEVCGRQFCSEERYLEHIQSELSCEFCDAQFTDNDDLRKHIESEHDLLEYRKIMSLRLKKRLKLGNKNATEYTCNLCGKKLFYKRTLLLHMRMHSGLKPYKCEYCHKAYASKHSLNAHLISEMNLRSYVCSYCGKRYNFNADLIVHVKQRHETRQFSCHVCGKEFGLLKYLKDHATIHSQLKPFNCDKCKMGFRLRKFLLRHNKKYHCEESQICAIEVVTGE